MMLRALCVTHTVLAIILANSPNHGGEPGQEFAPGSLPLTAKQTLAHCSVNPHIYGRKIPPPCVANKKAKIVATRIQKVASSAHFFMVQKTFGDGENEGFTTKVDECYPVDEKELQDWTVTTAIKNPYERWFSQFEQTTTMAFKENGWEKFPVEVRPYMVGIANNSEYEKMFCKPSGLEPENKKKSPAELGPFTWCSDDFTRRHSQFVSDLLDYSRPGEPFETHMHLQAPYLAWLPKLDYVYDYGDTDSVWTEKIGPKFNREVKLSRASTWPRRLNTSAVDAPTQRKICELLAIDFCCLNYPLPEFCANAPKEERVTCVWRKPSKVGNVQCNDNEKCIEVLDPKYSKKYLQTHPS